MGVIVVLNEIKALAARCQVSMNAACIRAGVAGSTPHRWGKGATPDPDNVARLRAAIIVVAHERGTLPADLQREKTSAVELLASLPAGETENPHEIVQDLKHNLRRLERSLKNGAQAATS